MPKRNTASVAVDNMNAASLAAADAMRDALAKIPAPNWMESIEFDRIVADKKFNVRDDASYAFAENKALYASLKANGLEVRGGDNMSFSVRPDGSVKVLTGHLRHAMMEIIRAETVKARLESSEPSESHTLPFATIFGLAFSGLSAEQELALMADHTMRKGLTEFELCKEIGEFMEAYKLTDAKASVKFGIEKNKVARMRMRYAMPTVFAEYRKEKGKDKSVAFVAVGQVALNNLYTAYLADQSAGCGYREEGANFRKLWALHIANPDALKSSKPSKPTAREFETIETQAKGLSATFGNNPEIVAIRDILGWTMGEERDGKPVNLQTAIESLQTYVNTLRSERDSAIDRALTLASDLESARETIASNAKDIEGYQAEIESLKSKPVKAGSKS